MTTNYNNSDLIELGRKLRDLAEELYQENEKLGTFLNGMIRVIEYLEKDFYMERLNVLYGRYANAATNSVRTSGWSPEIPKLISDELRVAAQEMAEARLGEHPGVVRATDERWANIIRQATQT